MIASLLLPALLSFAHAQAVVTPSLPGPQQLATLRVNGKPSIHRGGGDIYNTNDERSRAGDIHISGQDEFFQACLYKTRDGRPVKFSMDAENCARQALNKDVKLDPGSYVLLYQNTVGHAVLQPGAKTTINLRKIQAPAVTGGHRVELRINLSDRIEQDKQLFYIRLASETREAMAVLDRNAWAREFVLPYLNSGDPAAISQNFRDRAFNSDDGYCGLIGDADCSEQSVGAWNNEFRRSVCARLNVLWPTSNCEYEMVRYQWSSAYFLVFPGVYTMTWYRENGGETLRKTGIRVD